jgi:hypothetical protein
MRVLAPSRPYAFQSSVRKKRKATAGSVVVPDFETTLTEKSLAVQQFFELRRADALKLFPAK